MIIGMFGTWRAVEGDAIFSRALQYATAVAKAGHAVLTGGYAGVMEAANRGACEADGRSIGVTCPEMDRVLSVNPWVTERVEVRDIQDRFVHCFRIIDAAVFFPGRSGTISELAFALELREKGILQTPVFLTCSFWDQFMAAHSEANSHLPYPTSKPVVDLFARCSGPAELLGYLALNR